MILLARAAAALLAGIATGLLGAASADELIPVGHFNSVGIRGDARVTIRYGHEQRVVLVRGNTRLSRISLDEPRSGSLQIEECVNRCPYNYQVEVAITTPVLNGIAIDGDAVVKVEGGFPAADRMDLAIKGDGDIDARSASARHVDAAINGDGRISTHASETLTVAMTGDGTVTYGGNPHLRTVINGDGTVEASRSNTKQQD